MMNRPCDNALVLTSTFTLARNVQGHLFPPRLSDRDLVQMAPLFPGMQSLSALSPRERERLADTFGCREGFLNVREGNSYLIEDSLLLTTGMQDHLVFRAQVPFLRWEETWNALMALEKRWAEKHAFATHPRFGFLTSSIDACGTGLSYECLLHLPALTRLNNLDNALGSELDSSVKMVSANSDFVSIGNRFSLGISEDHLLHTVNSSAQKLERAERALRSHMGKNKEIRDQIARAYGLLEHSCQLQLLEALDALSLMLLGLDLGLVQGIEAEALVGLTTLIRRSYLPETGVLEEERAAFLKQRIAPLKLTI